MAATLPSSVSRRCTYTCCFPALFERPCSRVGSVRNHVCERDSFSLHSRLTQLMTRGYTSVRSRKKTTSRLLPSCFSRVSEILLSSRSYLGRTTPFHSSLPPREAASTKRAVSSAPLSRFASSKPFSSDSRPHSLSFSVPSTKGFLPPLSPLRSCVPSLSYRSKSLLSRTVETSRRSPASSYPNLRISPESPLLKRSFHTYGSPTGAFSSPFSHAGRGYEGSPFVPPRHATTILCVRKKDQVCVAGDGMVSQGSMIVKPNARKIRRLHEDVVCGFAGATADCFTLVEKLEAKLEEYPGQLLRACVELAKQWRTDRYLRHLEAVLIVADKKMSLEVSGVGDVLESHDGILGVGSGGPYAVAAARALYSIDGLTALDICKRSMSIAASMCCHTNDRIIFEVLKNEAPPSPTPTEPETAEENPKIVSEGKDDKVVATAE
ncbi:heat shock protein hslv [Cystoisospora suis]|uniref:Heat shock protein hslv n=1 Tax=Cystoisospora suis TaxID=483139 RepID=A0A2C6LHA0_9APIC|nr:heat shock protein hslv [Cystoisospora suis]